MHIVASVACEVELFARTPHPDGRRSANRECLIPTRMQGVRLRRKGTRLAMPPTTIAPAGIASAVGILACASRATAARCIAFAL
jgi:hypothetical protein